MNEIPVKKLCFHSTIIKSVKSVWKQKTKIKHIHLFFHFRGCASQDTQSRMKAKNKEAAKKLYDEVIIEFLSIEVYLL